MCTPRFHTAYRAHAPRTHHPQRRRHPTARHVPCSCTAERCSAIMVHSTAVTGGTAYNLNPKHTQHASASTSAHYKRAGRRHRTLRSHLTAPHHTSHDIQHASHLPTGSTRSRISDSTLRTEGTMLGFYADVRCTDAVPVGPVGSLSSTLLWVPTCLY